MPYKIELKTKASKFLETIPKNDKEKIIDRIEELSKNPRNEQVIKLSGIKPDLYRARQGIYRILFSIEDKKLLIEVIDIKHRKNAY